MPTNFYVSALFNDFLKIIQANCNFQIANIAVSIVYFVVWVLSFVALTDNLRNFFNCQKYISKADKIRQRINIKV